MFLLVIIGSMRPAVSSTAPLRRWRSCGLDASIEQEERPVGELLDQTKAMGDEHDRLATFAELSKGLDAFLLEALVANREHLDEQQDVEVDLDSDCIRQAYLHPGREVLELLVDEALELREGHDVVVARLERAAIKPQQRAVDADVVPRGKLGIEAHAEFDER